MEDRDLLGGFDAPKEESWDDRSTSQSDRASSSTYSDVPSFAKPPKLETQESVNLLDLGASQGDSDQASVNLLEFTVSPVNTRVDFMSSELQLPPAQPPQLTGDNPSLPVNVDVFASATTTTTNASTPMLPFGTKPTMMNSNIDVFADMVRTAKELDAKSPNCQSTTHAQSRETKQETSPSATTQGPKATGTVHDSTGSESDASQTVPMNHDANGEPSSSSSSPMSPNGTVPLQGGDKAMPNSARKADMVSNAALNDGSCPNNTMESAETPPEQQSPGRTLHLGSKAVASHANTSPTAKPVPHESAPPTTNGFAPSQSLNSPLAEHSMPVTTNQSPGHEKQQQQQPQAPPTPSPPEKDNPPPDMPPTTPSRPHPSPQQAVRDTLSASQASESTTSSIETPIAPTILEISATPDTTETNSITSGNKDISESIVSTPHLPNDPNATIPQSPQASVNQDVDESNSSPQTSNAMVDGAQNQQELAKAATTTTPLTPDPSQLLNKIQELEQQLQQAQSTIVQLQETHAKDEQDATVHGKLLVELQNNLQTQMKLRAEAEDKTRRAAMLAKTYKDKLEALQVESKESMEQLGATLGKITAAKSNLEMELEAVQKERDDKVRREAAMALQLNVISKIVAEKANSAEYYENQADQLKRELDATKNKLSQTTQERDQIKEELAEWKEYSEKRSKQLEAALAKEKMLNDERKRKMKQFVEAKSEEVRVAKADCAALQSEMDQSNMAVKDMNQRYKQLHAQWVESQTRNRELQRDLTKMQKDSEKMSKVGGTLEAKLSRSAMESEDHKNKRLAAKNELMAVLRQLEAERDVNNRLREKIKMTFTPKVLNQQQSLRELLDRFEDTMLKVATKLGRPLPPAPPPTIPGGEMENSIADLATEGLDDRVTDSSAAATGVSEANIQRVLARLDHETKRVSHSIESINDSVRRLNSLVETPATRGCVDAFSALLMTTSHT